jgi:hypothetical protein
MFAVPICRAGVYFAVSRMRASREMIAPGEVVIENVLRNVRRAKGLDIVVSIARKGTQSSGFPLS